MPFNGAGVFQRVRNWVADATAGIKIRADYHDNEDDGFAAGLTNCITKDGQTLITENIPFNSKRITGLADPINAQDATTKAYTDNKLTTSESTQKTYIDTGDAAANANADKRVLRAGDAMTGALISAPATENIGGAGGAGTFEVRGNAANAAMTFHIPNIFAANFGLSNDGNFYMGGYSHGAVAHRFWTTRDFNYTPQANLGFTPVQQNGGLYQSTNKVYIGWDGTGLRAQVDSTDLGRFTFGNGVKDGRLLLAGDWGVPYDNSGVVREPYAGAVMTGCKSISSPVYVIQVFRMRWMQLYTSDWYTVGLAG